MRTIAFVLILTVAAAGQSGSRDDVVSRLESKVSVDFRGAKLSEAVAQLQSLSGVEFRVEEGADTVVRLTLCDVSARSVLKLLLQPAGLAATFVGGVVTIRSREKLLESVSTRIYDVRSKELKLRDFPGIHVQRPALLKASWYMETDCHFGQPFLVELILENTGGRSWEISRQAAITLNSGMLIVCQTPRVHQEVEDLLARLPF